MIHTIRTITVGQDECVIDRPIMLYRGDRDLEVEFSLVGNSFMFGTDGNVLASMQAKYAQLVVNTPSGLNMFSDIVACRKGNVIFTIRGEMIDEIKEVGMYAFQIRLLDATQTSRVTLPPVYNGIEIRQPIAAEDQENITGDGVVDYAELNRYTSETGPTFNSLGDYNKTTWQQRDIISAYRMNKIEDALYQINEHCQDNIDIHENQIAQLEANYNASFENVNKNINERIEYMQGEVNEAEAALNAAREHIDGAVAEMNVAKNDMLQTKNDIIARVDADIAAAEVELQTYIDNVMIEVNLACPPPPLEGIMNGDDVTSKLQAIISELGSNKRYILPYGAYTCSGPISLVNLSNVELDGSGSTIMLTASDVLFKFGENIENIDMHDFKVVGSGDVADGNGLLGNPSGTFINFANIHDNEIRDCVVAISLNADNGGHVRNSIIANNRIFNIVGEEPGQGYGIHIANVDANFFSNNVISGNYIEKTERHGIYVARGNGYIIENNTVRDNRYGKEPIGIRAAIHVGRTRNVIIRKNTVINALQGCIALFDGGVDYLCENVLITENRLIESTHSGSIVLNYEPSTTPNGVRNINIQNNFIIDNSKTTNGIVIGSGKNIDISNNTMDGVLNGIVLNQNGENAETNTYTDNVRIYNNIIETPSGQYGIRINGTSMASISIMNNKLTGFERDICSNVMQTNPNIFMENQSNDGMYFEGTSIKTKETQSLYIRGGMQILDHRWNSKPLILGDYYLWLTSGGILRIKNGPPESETDGTVVGTQA